MKKTLRVQGASPLRFTLYPTGEFSATLQRETASLVPPEYAEGYEKASAYLARSCACPGRPTSGFVAEQIPPLGLSKVPNSHTKTLKRGRKGISRYNKRLVTNSCLLLERKYGRKHLSFLTLTLPPECANGSADSYRESKRQMFQWLQRSLSRRGISCEIVGCTEVQTSRLDSKNQFALHEHWIFVGRLQHKTWALSPAEIQSQWLSILGRVFKVGISPSHSKAAVNIQRVKRSAGAYLGKYISKGVDVIVDAIAKGLDDCLPSSWVTRSASMLKMYRSSILKMCNEESSILIEILKSNASIYCRYQRDISILSEKGFNIWIAWVGWLNPAGMKFVGTVAKGAS